MDAADLDQVLLAALLAEAADGVQAVGMELATLYDGWVARGDCPDAVAWMRTVLERLGWWAGKLEHAADPALVDRFPTLE